MRAGFEPAVQFPARQFSKLLVSASHPPHPGAAANVPKNDSEQIFPAYFFNSLTGKGLVFISHLLRAKIKEYDRLKAFFLAAEL